MTLDQLRDDAWNAGGKPSDLDPDTDTQDGGSPILTRIANEAQRQVALWKDPSTGRHMRFRRLISELYFKSVLTSETLDDAATDASNVVLPSTDVGTQDDRYNGWGLEIGSETKLITDYVGSTRTATVHEAFATTPAVGNAYKLYKRFWLLVPSTHAWVADHISLPATSDRYRAEGNLYEVLKIEDLVDTRVLDKAERTEAFTNFVVAVGDPREWFRLGNRLYVDTNVDEAKWFRMEYYRLPTDMSAATDEPEIPETFHYGINLWMIWWIHRRRMESDEAYATKRDFVDYMVTHRTEAEVADERASASMSLRLK